MCFDQWIMTSLWLCYSSFRSCWMFIHQCVIEKYLELVNTSRVLFSREVMPGHILLGTPTKKLEGFDWVAVVTLHPTYSSGLASSDYHLFTSVVAPATDRTPCQTMTIGYNGLHVAY